MDRSQRNAPTLFLVGCLFILLLLAIQMWPAVELGRGVSRPIADSAHWALAGDNIPYASPVPVPDDSEQQDLAASVGEQEYGATIRAEVVLSAANTVDVKFADSPTSQRLDELPVREPEAFIEAPTPAPTSIPAVSSPETVPPTPASDLPFPEIDPVTIVDGGQSTTPKLELPHSFADAAPNQPLVKKSDEPAPPTTAGAITPDPYTAKSLSSPWPHVPALQRQLDEQLAGWPLAWAGDVTQHLEALHRQSSIHSEPSLLILQHLDQLVTGGKRGAEKLSDPLAQARLRQAVYALERRLLLWSQIANNADPQFVAQLELFQRRLSPQGMLQVLDRVDADLQGLPDNWQRFLSLAHIRDVASSASFSDTETRSNVAVKVLNRLNETEFDLAQKAIVEQASIVALQAELRKWTTAPIELSELMARVEEYEIEPTATRSQPLSSAWNKSRWSLFPAQRRMAQVLDTHYRNANIRFAVTEEFINRLVPAIQDVKAPVRDQILGADVRGLSETRTRFRVNLVPDSAQIRMHLEGDGVMSAATESTKGGVTLMNRNRARFFVQKMLLMDPRGVWMGQTQSAASGSTDLTGLRTRYDTFPIVGPLVRRAVQKQAFQSRALAESAFESRVASKARTQMDTKLQQQMMVARQRLDEKVIQPMEKLQLNPTALAMETTEERMTLRGRLASDSQLASFTARPQARADSVLSIQVHESAMNNFTSQLQLSGKEGNIKDVIREVAAEAGMSQFKIPDEVPDGVKIRLAKEDPFRFQFQDGRIMIALRIDGLKYERRSWRNFEVRAYYTPKIKGFSCDLHRDEHIELIGKRLKSRHQIALRGIFTKVFSKNRPITLVHPELAKDQRLAQLDVSQFVVRDGWVGVSVGHQANQSPAVPAQSQPQTAHRHQRRTAVRR